MKTTSTAVVLTLAGGLVLVGSREGLAVPGKAVTNSSQPYPAITERNVFGLKEKPDEGRRAEAPKPPVNIKISGFVQHATQGTRVLLATVPKDPKEQMKFYNLGVGETEDGVQLVKIHPGESAVDVVIDGVPEELTVKSNSFLTGLYGNGAGQHSAPTQAPGVRRWPVR